jgi:phosphate starvation-inducible PhoH-like protein
MAKSKALDDLGFNFVPKGESQRRACEVWKSSRIMFLLGGAGTGKSSLSMALGLQHLTQHPKSRLWLTRPQITCDNEQMGFLKGDMGEKFGPFLGPLMDVFTSFSDAKWSDLEKTLADRLEVCPIAYLRGRTIRQSVMLAEEMQNASESQLLCLLTRIGQGGRVILTGDAQQSDRYSIKDCPLVKVAKKLAHVEGVSVCHFSPEDQLRDPLVAKILDAW